MITKNIRSGRLLDLLELMAEHDYIGLTEAKFYCRFFCGEKDKYAKRAAARYLSYLRKKQWAIPFSTPFRDRWRLWCLTDLGYEVLKGNRGLRIERRFVPSKFRFSMMHHNLAVVQARVIFESDPRVKDFIPEKVAHKLYYEKHGEVIYGKACDAEIKIETPKGKYNFGLEVQLSRKSGDTLHKYYGGLEKRGDLDRIAWVCGNDDIMRVFQKAARSPGVTQFHMYTTLSELKEKGLQKSCWENRKGEKFYFFKD